ncbi:MAG: hypothetical protein MHM6MM_004621 [Cercozoa sp. M6MM]
MSTDLTESHADAPPTQPVRKPSYQIERRIVVAVDDSETARKAFDWVCTDMYRAGDQIVLVHALEADHSVSSMPIDGLSAAAMKHMREEELRRAKRLVQSFTSYLKREKLHYLAKIVSGDARSVLVGECRQVDADLLVVGSRGRGRVSRALLGSVSDYCVRHCKCPVTVVRADAQLKRIGSRGTLWGSSSDLQSLQQTDAINARRSPPSSQNGK